MIYSLENNTPQIHKDAFIAPSADIIGKVTIGARSSIWFNAVLRGDLAEIRIGEETNIQDGSVLHVDTDGPVIMGNGITVGHSAVVHACTIGDNCLIGMNATVLSGAVIGNDCLIGAGALVSQGMKVPDGSVVLGCPGKVVKNLKAGAKELIRQGAFVYVREVSRYRESLQQVNGHS